MAEGGIRFQTRAARDLPRRQMELGRHRFDPSPGSRLQRNLPRGDDLRLVAWSAGLGAATRIARRAPACDRLSVQSRIFLYEEPVLDKPTALPERHRELRLGQFRHRNGSIHCCRETPQTLASCCAFWSMLSGAMERRLSAALPNPHGTRPDIPNAAQLGDTNGPLR